MSMPEIPSLRRRHNTAVAAGGSLILILALASLLRCDRLALPPLSADEAFSWRVTTYPTAEMLRHVSGDAHPPLYYLLLKGWIALFGDSPFALRSLSVLFALASILVLYALCREASDGLKHPSLALRASEETTSHSSGALFAALLLAIHIAPVDEPSRTVRMYSQGIFLAGLTAWLLLRALRCPRGCLGWWLGYGLAVATFCYTHYYAFFTVAAQTLFVAGDLAIRALGVPTRNVGTRGIAAVRASLTGFLLAGGFAFLLYVPWLPVWWKQTHDVWQNFWIQPVTVEHARRVFFLWSSGLPSYDAVDFWWWIFFLLACIVWIVGKADRGGLFFLLQAALPWGLSLTLSAWSGRSIFLERYLFFAQFSLFAFWGIVWDRLPGLLPRLGLACLLCTLSVFGLMGAREQWPTRPPVLADATAFLRDHYQDGDVVLTGDPMMLNRLRYYAAQARMPTMAARCLVSPFQPPGHVVHISSLRAEDVLWTGSSSELHAFRRVWTLAEARAAVPLPGEHWREVSHWSFGGENKDHYQLVLYERP